MSCTVYKVVARLPISQERLEKVGQWVLNAEGRSGAAVSIHCVGEKRIRQLNRQWRGKDEVTDVLSFATSEGKILSDTKDYGDIFLCIPELKRQARRFQMSESEEMARMLIHGLLHLFGYDHTKKLDAKKMFAKQEKYLEHVI